MKLLVLNHISWAGYINNKYWIINYKTICIFIMYSANATVNLAIEIYEC